jgi:hypothetical protein
MVPIKLRGPFQAGAADAADEIAGAISGVTILMLLIKLRGPYQELLMLPTKLRGP